MNTFEFFGVGGTELSISVISILICQYITMTIAKNDFTTSLCHKQQHDTNLVNNNFCYLS